jgi:DNA adenine methylase
MSMLEQLESAPGSVPRPFLKWAGGKGQLLSELDKRLPDAFGAYHEPFMGGGALFFHLFGKGRLGDAHLSDVNPVLVDTYLGVRDCADGVIAALGTHLNESEHFYAVRSLDPATLDHASRTARMIYLNRTCFNGLWRENSSGRFNVPFGRYRNPKICDPSNLRAVSRALARTSLECRGFESILDRARPGDLVYLDPPYDPLSATASFTAYSRSAFGEAEQRRLAGVFGTLAERGTFVILSNSDTPRIRDLYARFRIDPVQVSRSINSRADRRGPVGEVIVLAGPGL